MTDDLITIGGMSLPMIKPLVGFRPEIERQLEKFPYEANVFLMMRFRDTNKALSDFIIETLKEAGLNGVRADQSKWNITNNVYNPIAVLYCCKYGIALFDEAEAKQAYNPNVIYELGMMHCLKRECLILRNDSLPAIPFDLVKDLYMPYKGDLAVRTNVRVWLQQIAPGDTMPRSPTGSTGESKLEYAAVAAPVDERDSVVASPDHIVSSEFKWAVSSKTKKAWEVSWRIKLTNNRQKPTAVEVQVLFLDESGFALEDHMGTPKKALPVGKTVFHESTATMSPDLAKRIRRAMATVSTVRK